MGGTSTYCGNFADRPAPELVRRLKERFPAMQPGQGRFNVSLYHTYRIQDEITIRDGLPEIGRAHV